MGRPPGNGAPAFRFNQSEVAQMEAILQEHNWRVPTKDFLVALAEKFSKAPERDGKVTVQMKQLWSWFQNRRFALNSRLLKSPATSNASPMPQDKAAPVKSPPPCHQQINKASASGVTASIPSETRVTASSHGHSVKRSTSETPPLEFEAKSARDGAWYDVQAFLSVRFLETGNPEVLVRFAGFGPEEDEWVNVRKNARQRSLPCEVSTCITVLPGDRVLCYQEYKEQALYFDALVLNAHRRRHDMRGCRCRFLVRYEHDLSEEFVPLWKVCRRPETVYRLRQLQAANEVAIAPESVSAGSQKPLVDPVSSSGLKVANRNLVAPAMTGIPTTNMGAISAANVIPPAPFSKHTVASVPVSVPIASQQASTSAPVLVPAPTSTLVPAPTSTLVPAPAPTSTLVSLSAPPLVSGLASAPVSITILEPEVERCDNNKPQASLEASNIRAT